MGEWTAEELNILQQNMGLPAKKLSEMLGRTTSAIYWKIARLKNCKKEGVTQDVKELVYKHAYIKSDEWIADLTGFPVYVVKGIREKGFNKKKDRPYVYQTLCIYCKNATGGCSWSRSFKPVNGWAAIEKTINYHRGKSKNDGKNAKREMSYAVKECPEYRRG